MRAAALVLRLRDHLLPPCESRPQRRKDVVQRQDDRTDAIARPETSPPSPPVPSVDRDRKSSRPSGNGRGTGCGRNGSDVRLFELEGGAW